MYYCKSIAIYGAALEAFRTFLFE